MKTEYWVSNARKFCDFCKCSIADTKANVQFHENGKKHKENVRKRLLEMQKKATKDAKAASTVEKQMKKMEDAAMKAYMKDIQENPDFTSQVIKEKLESTMTHADTSTASAQLGEKKPPEKSTKTKAGSSSIAKQKPPLPSKVWLEAKSEEGYTYYWHVETGESVWEEPKEGFISIEEQEAPSEPKPKKKAPTPTIKKDSEKVSVSEINKQIYRSELDSREVKNEPPDDSDHPVVGPQPRVDPYGGWTTIVKAEPKMVDLQLPEADKKPIVAPVVVHEVKSRIFKEKKAPASSIPGTEVTFKKRKLAGGRNMRQREDDD